jgi:hypothetical protein
MDELRSLNLAEIGEVGSLAFGEVGDVCRDWLVGYSPAPSAVAVGSV